MGSGNGKDEHGRFMEGWKGGPGGRLNKHQHEIRRWFSDCVTQDDVVTAYRKLMELVRAGDITAIKEFLDRVLGKAKQAVELSGRDGDHLDLHTVTATILQVIGGDDTLRVKVAAAFSELGKARGRDALELDA